MLLAVSRHIYRRLPFGYNPFPFGYDPLYWGAVFPLGIYAVATHEIGRALELNVLEFTPRVFVWIALAAWALTFSGLARHLFHVIRGTLRRAADAERL